MADALKLANAAADKAHGEIELSDSEPTKLKHQWDAREVLEKGTHDVRVTSYNGSGSVFKKSTVTAKSGLSRAMDNHDNAYGGICKKEFHAVPKKKKDDNEGSTNT